MTAPVDSAGFAQVTADIAAIQARIAALTPKATSSTSSSNFAAALSSVNGSEATTATSPSTTTGPTSLFGTPTTTTAQSATSSAASGSAIVADAKKYLGVPYVWGGETRSGGMDCSGLVQTTFHDLGVNLPRTAAEQSHSGTPVASLADAKPGDLLFFGDPAYHVAIYAGNNMLVESPEPGKTVHETHVYQTPTSIRRISLPGATAAVTTPGGLSAGQLTSAGISSAVANYAAKFAAVEARNGLPKGMLAAVAQQESGGNPHAVSPAGAEGLMQLMPATAASYGVNPFDADQAIDAAGKILGASYRRYHGSVPLALAAYNAGPGAVAQYGGIPPYSETQNYVKRITAMMAAGG